MAQPNPKTRRNSKAQWFDQVLNNDGGAALIEKLGFEPQNRKKQGDDQSISFICIKGTYIFTKWNESDASGNAIRFFQFVNNLSDWKQSVWAISEFLGIESYIKTNGNEAVFVPKIRKASKKEKKQVEKQEQKPAPKNCKDLEFREFSQADYDHFAKKHSCHDVEKIKEIIKETKILAVKGKKFVYAIETLEGIKEYRIIQPFYAKGRDFKVFGNSKRVFYPSLEKTKKAEPNYQFSMGMDSPKDLSKAIILPSGESDFLTLRMHGYQAVCLGGEGQKFNEYSLAIMRKNGYSPKNLSILFDNDSNKAGFKPEKDKNTGLEFAKKLSAAYKIPYLKIPDFPNLGIKDVSDFFAINGEDNKEWFEKYILNLPNFETSLKSQRLFTKEKYYAKDRYIVETIKNLIKFAAKSNLAKSNKVGNRFILIDSAAGSGKTDFFLNKNSLFWNDPEIQKLFDTSIYAVPTITLAKQMSEKYGTQALYAGKQAIDLTEQVRVLATFDSVKKINFDIKLVHIDEFHMLTNDFAYRKKAMKWLFNLVKCFPNAVFVFTTATSSKYLIKAWEKMHGKITRIRIDSPQEKNYIVCDCSFEQGIKKEDKENILLQNIIKNYQNQTDRISVVHINSKAQIEKCIEKLVALGIPRREIDYFISHKWNISTKTMDSIVQKELIPKGIKILFCTNAIVQGLNINNECVFDLFVYSNGNHKISTKNFIQLCNRFRKAKVNVMLMNSEFAKERDPLSKQIESDKKRIAIEKIVRDLNKLQGNDLIKVNEKINKVRETYDIHALEQIDHQFCVSELYFAAEQEQIEESCLSTKNYLNKIVETGRGIVLYQKFDKTQFQILPAIEVQAQNKNINISLNFRREELRENICQELGKDPQPLLKVVLDKTKDDQLKKKIIYLLLGVDLEKIPNTKVEFREKSITEVDTIEKFVANFLYFLDLTQKSYQEVAEIVLSCHTPRELKKQKQFFVLENMHKDKEKSLDHLSNLDLNNIKEFQQVAMKLIAKTITTVKTEVDKPLFYEDLYCLSKYPIFAGRTFSRYDCRDLFENLFDFTEKQTQYKDKQTGKQKRQYWMENIKAFFEW